MSGDKAGLGTPLFASISTACPIGGLEGVGAAEEAELAELSKGIRAFSFPRGVEAAGILCAATAATPGCGLVLGGIGATRSVSLNVALISSFCLASAFPAKGRKVGESSLVSSSVPSSTVPSPGFFCRW